MGDFPGLCKTLHETTPSLYGTTWDSRRAYLSFPYFCRYRFELVLLRVDDGRDWSTMVSDELDLSMLVYRYQLRPSFRPWASVARQPSSSEMDDLHSLSSAACFFWLGVHKLGCMDEWFGLPRSRHVSLRRSVHDACFVCGVCDRWGTLCFFGLRTLFLSGVGCMSRSTFWR